MVVRRGVVWCGAVMACGGVRMWEKEMESGRYMDSKIVTLADVMVPERNIVITLLHVNMYLMATQKRVEGFGEGIERFAQKR